MVGTVGFEPTTPTTPLWCATKLRYAPSRSALGYQHRPKKQTINPMFIRLSLIKLLAMINCRFEVSNIGRSMSDYPLSKDELARRKPVWLALSELWLDTELTEVDINHIATKMVESGYSLAELRVICDSEIAPVVYSNLRSPAGVWDGFDEHWLFEQIIAEMNKPKRWQNAFLQDLINLWWRKCFW